MLPEDQQRAEQPAESEPKLSDKVQLHQGVDPHFAKTDAEVGRIFRKAFERLAER